MACCAEPWPLFTFVNGKPRWHCQCCGKILSKRADRAESRKRAKVVKEGEATTLDSFGP